MDENFKTQLQILISSGERTRTILYFFGLIFAAIAAVTFDSNEFNWTAKRHTIMAKAYACYIHDKLSPSAKSPVPDCKKYYDIVKDYYDINVDQPPISDEPKKIRDAIDYPNSFEPMRDRYDLLSQAYVENAYTTVPILSMKLEKNNVFLFAIFVEIMAFSALTLCFENNKKCVRNISELITNKIEVDAVINCHVFAKPRKYSYAFWWFLFVPLTMAVWDFYTNVTEYNTVRRILDEELTMKFFTTQLTLTTVLALATIACFRSAMSLDRELVKTNSKVGFDLDTG